VKKFLSNESDSQEESALAVFEILKFAHTGKKQMLKLFLVSLIFLTGCAKSLVPGHYREDFYVTDRGKAWQVHVVDAYRIGIECVGIPLPGIIHGCIIPSERGQGKAYIIDSLAAAKHECGHIQALGDGSTSANEWLKDIFYGHFLLTGMFLFTAPIPAPDLPCGESAIYTGVPGAGSPFGGRLLTREEWNGYFKDAN